jgi:hypothetical protein
MFGHSLGHVHSPEQLFRFAEKPSKTPSSELSQEIKDKFELDPREKDERLDQIRRSEKSLPMTTRCTHLSVVQPRPVRAIGSSSIRLQGSLSVASFTTSFKPLMGN